VTDGAFPVFLYSKKPEKRSLAGPLGENSRTLGGFLKYRRVLGLKCLTPIGDRSALLPPFNPPSGGALVFIRQLHQDILVLHNPIFFRHGLATIAHARVQ
jgi:hypothetical protein